MIEERHGDIQLQVVNNDGSRESYIILTGLKCIFQKQLPKMPKEYIARLVYDRTHLSLAIVKKGMEVVGYVLSFPSPGSVAKERKEASHTALSILASSPRSCSAPFRPTSRSKAMAHT